MWIPGFEDVIDKNDSMIGDIDYILLCNSYWLDDTTPCINYGLRGVLHATVEVYSDNPDLHSGVEGGATREPTIDLIRLLALLTTPEGDICLPDFYKRSSRPPSLKRSGLSISSRHLISHLPRLLSELNGLFRRLQCIVSTSLDPVT